MPDSSISKLFEKSRKERLDIVANFANLSSDELDVLQNENGGISYENADKMVENATFSPARQLYWLGSFMQLSCH